MISLLFAFSHSVELFLIDYPSDTNMMELELKQNARYNIYFPKRQKYIAALPSLLPSNIGAYNTQGLMKADFFTNTSGVRVSGEYFTYDSNGINFLSAEPINGSTYTLIHYINPDSFDTQGLCKSIYSTNKEFTIGEGDVTLDDEKRCIWAFSPGATKFTIDRSSVSSSSPYTLKYTDKGEIKDGSSLNEITTSNIFMIYSKTSFSNHPKVSFSYTKSSYASDLKYTVNVGGSSSGGSSSGGGSSGGGSSGGGSSGGGSSGGGSSGGGSSGGGSSGGGSTGGGSSSGGSTGAKTSTPFPYHTPEQIKQRSRNSFFSRYALWLIIAGVAVGLALIAMIVSFFIALCKGESCGDACGGSFAICCICCLFFVH